MTNPELIQKWQHVLDKSAHIFTWTEPLTLAWLCEQAHLCNLVVESGTYMGKSAFVMAAAMKEHRNGHIWAVDPFAVDGTYEVSKYFLRELPNCTIMKMRLDAAVDQLSKYKGHVDMVFADDGHSYENLVYDITHGLSILKSGGLLCGHDLDRNPDNDVTKAVKELLPGFTEPVPRLWSYIKP